ncbi:hypothetical protein OBB00_06310 [Gammaproteobacteria bacterium]|nr:hypothetical protein [Gammaproteobacteria bacterium]
MTLHSKASHQVPASLISNILANRELLFWSLQLASWFGISLISYVSLNLWYNQPEWSYVLHNIHSQYSVSSLVGRSDGFFGVTGARLELVDRSSLTLVSSSAQGNTCARPLWRDEFTGDSIDEDKWQLIKGD